MIPLLGKVKVDFKNAFENALWVILGASIGAVITYMAVIKTAKETSDNLLTSLVPTIEKAIDKETIKNEIKNEIEIKDVKVKKSDSLNININQEPFNDQKPTNNLTKTVSSDCEVSKEQFNKLSDNRKKRLKRWLED